MNPSLQNKYPFLNLAQRESVGYSVLQFNGIKEPAKLGELFDAFTSRCNTTEPPEYLGEYVWDFEKIKKMAKEIKKSDKLSNMIVKDILYHRGTAFVLETAEGDVLKLTLKNHFPYNRKQQEFDLPIKKKARVGFLGKMRWYLEEKCKPTEDQNLVTEMKRRIWKAGFVPYDMYTEQIGIAKDGKAYLLDPECANGKIWAAKLKSKYKKISTKLERLLLSKI